MDSGHPNGEALSAISNGLAHLHMRFYGRGPTKAKAHFVDDLVVCVLWNGFTTVEQTLLARGETAAVEAFRRTFQSTMEAQFTEVVEEGDGPQGPRLHEPGPRRPRRRGRALPARPRRLSWPSVESWSSLGR